MATQLPRSRAPAFAAIALVLGVLLGAVLIGSIRVGSLFGGTNPETVASASLQAMREQARLTPFSARFVAVVTTSQSRLGFRTEKTLIMPGTVRYEIDLSRLRQRDLDWDEGSRTLTIALPALEISEPQVSLGEVREYGQGGVLMALTGGEAQLDQANRARGRVELLRQARDPVPMRLARDAAKRAIERSFAMPMRAAGIEANIVVRFPEEGTQDPSFIDHSRSINEVLEEQRARGR
jgi:hypothetical protein